MSAKPKQPTSPTLAAYHGQTSRLCAALGIVPPPCANRVQAEFDAVAAWLQDRQTKSSKSESINKSEVLDKQNEMEQLI